MHTHTHTHLVRLLLALVRARHGVGVEGAVAWDDSPSHAWLAGDGQQPLAGLALHGQGGGFVLRTAQQLDKRQGMKK